MMPLPTPAASAAGKSGLRLEEEDLPGMHMPCLSSFDCILLQGEWPCTHCTRISGSRHYAAFAFIFLSCLEQSWAAPKCLALSLLRLITAQNNISFFSVTFSRVLFLMPHNPLLVASSDTLTFSSSLNCQKSHTHKPKNIPNHWEISSQQMLIPNSPFSRLLPRWPMTTSVILIAIPDDNSRIVMLLFNRTLQAGLFS